MTAITSTYSQEELEKEIDRLEKQLSHLKWTREDCAIIAPLTLEINKLKKEKNAIILAHSYQMPQIMFGISDFVGDSFGLSKQAMNTDADTIVFCGVEFMAETAKIMNPDKTVLLPSREAGCSLADGITADDVRKLKQQYPGLPVACYINTTAAVKAECDVVVTSANAVKILNSFNSDTVIFVPDRHMAKNLEALTGKKLIGWNAECVVHDEFSAEQIQQIRADYEGVKILAHSECDPSVIQEVDLVGGTGDMIRYIESHPEVNTFALITECGLSERMQVEHPDKTFVGTCMLCPFMKKITLENVLQVLKDPQPDQIITLPENVMNKARKSLETMFELSK